MCPVFELGHREERVEWRPVADVGDPAVFDGELFEHGGVELPAGGVVGFAVGVCAAGGNLPGEGEDLLPFGLVGVEVGERVPGSGDVGADALLLGLEGGDVDGAGVVGVEQLAPLGFGLGELGGEQFALGGVAVLAVDGFGGHFLLQPGQPGLGQLDPLVDGYDLVLADT